MAVGKKTGGRQKGVKNKATVEREFITADRVAKIEAEGITPLEYMLKILRDEAQEPKDRFAAAKEAAPYLHAKLASIEHKGDAQNPLQVIGHIFGAALNGTGRVPVQGPDHDAEDDVRGSGLAS